jgi:hypothetical protein
MDLMEKTVIEEEIGWWEVKFITISPFTDTSMFLGNSKDEVRRKFKQTPLGDKQIKDIIKIS